MVNICTCVLLDTILVQELTPKYIFCVGIHRKEKKM